MSERQIEIDEREIEEQIASLLRSYKDRYNHARALGPLKSTAYTRLLKKDLLNVYDIKVQYSLIANKQCKLSSDERALIAFFVNTATGYVINGHMQKLDEIKVRDKIEVKTNG